MADLVLNIIMKASDKASDAFSRLGRAGRSLSSVLHDNQQELRQVEAAQKRLANYNQLKTELSRTSHALAENRRRQQELAQQIGKTGVATKAQTREMRQLAQRSTELQSKQQRQRTSLMELNTTLRQHGINTGKAADAQAELARRHQTATQAAERQKAALSRLNRAQEGVDKARSSAAGWAAASASTAIPAAAIGRGLAVPIREYAYAESAGMDLRVAMMDNTGRVAAEYQQIDALATRLGDQLPGTTADFKNLMTMLIRQGMSAQTILGGTGEAAAYLAVQLQKTPEQAAEMAAKLQDAVRATEGEMLGLVDTVQRLYYAGVEDSNILGAFSKLSPALGITRVKGEAALKMFGPLIGMLDQAGLSGESAGNALRKVFTLAMDTARIDKALRNAGAEHLQLDFTNGKGEFGGIEQMYTQLAKLQQLNTEQRLRILKAIFGDDDETQQALNTMIAKGQAGYDEFAGKLERQASLQQRIDATLGTLTNLWDSATGSFTNFMVALGESIQGEVKTIVGWIDTISTKLGIWARENPGTANTILKIIATIGILLAVFAALAAVVSAVLVPFAMLKMSWVVLLTSFAGGAGKLGILAQGFTMLRTALLGFGRAAAVFLVSNPFGWVILAVGAIYMLYTYWDSVQAGIVAGWKRLDMAFANNPILNVIFPIIGAARLLINNWNIIGPYFARLWEQIKSYFNGGLSAILARIAGFSPLGLFMRAFNAVLSWFAGGLPESMRQAGARLIQSIIDGIQSKIGAMIAIVRRAASVFNGLANTARSAPPGAAGAAIGARVAGYSRGGYTGHGGVHEAAGIVHRGEVVFSQRDVARFGGWRAVERLRAGGTRALRAISGLMPTPDSFGGSSGGRIQMAGDTVTIHVHATAQQNPEQIAAAVARELDRRNAAKQRRANSAYRDKD